MRDRGSPFSRTGLAGELRVKANDGTLSEAERAEYEELVEGLDLFSILKAKARAVLAKHAS